MERIMSIAGNSRSIAGNRMWMGVLTLAVTMPFAGAAVGQKKSAPAKAAPAPQKAAVKTPPAPVRPGNQPGVKPGNQPGVRPGTQPGVKTGPTSTVKPVSVHTDPKELPEGKKVPTANGGSVLKKGDTVTQYSANNRPVAMQKRD